MCICAVYNCFNFCSLHFGFLKLDSPNGAGKKSLMLQVWLFDDYVDYVFHVL